MREVLTVLLAVLLTQVNMSAAVVDAAAVKERVLGIGAGAPVEIRLDGKGKVRGRMGAVDDSGFVVQVVKDGKVEPSKIGFGEVKSIKNLSEESFGKSVGKGFLIAGITLGVIMVIGLVVCATGGCSN
jgi:hypothetical protein